MRDPSRDGFLEWEMLARDLDMAIFGDVCCWERPTRQPMSKADVLRLAEELAGELKVRLEVIFSGQVAAVYPKPR